MADEQTQEAVAVRLIRQCLQRGIEHPTTMEKQCKLAGKVADALLLSQLHGGSWAGWPEMEEG